jgi:hypothetical protein
VIVAALGFDGVLAADAIASQHVYLVRHWLEVLRVNAIRRATFVVKF